MCSPQVREVSGASREEEEEEVHQTKCRTHQLDIRSPPALMCCKIQSPPLFFNVHYGGWYSMSENGKGVPLYRNDENQCLISQY